jgi:Tat protein secretion system quality control protein TatD with DNase activity
MFTDSHAHITKEFYDDIDSIIQNAKDNKVNRIIIDADSI